MKKFKFSGHCVGSADGFPEEIGEYSTVNNGTLSRYKKGARFVGQHVRVKERYSNGSPHYPSSYSAVYEENPAQVEETAVCRYCRLRANVVVRTDGEEVPVRCSECGNAGTIHFTQSEYGCVFGNKYGGRGQAEYQAESPEGEVVI